MKLLIKGFFCGLPSFRYHHHHRHHLKDNGAATETEMDAGGENNSVESPLPFHQGEHVLVQFIGHIHQKAKVLQVDTRAKQYFVHYQGFNKKWDEWVGVERLIKVNKQNQKAPEKEIPLKKITKFKLINSNGKSDNKRKTMSKGGAVEGPMDKPVGSTLPPPFKHGPELREPRVAEPSSCFIPGWSLTNDADLFDPDSASDFMTHVLPPKTKTKLLAMPETEFWKSYDSAVVNNFAYMVEMKRRYETLKAKENEVKEELTRCKAIMTSQAKDISIAAEVAVRMQKELDDANGKVKEMQAERDYVIKGASRAEAARAQAEVETSALRAGSLELLGRLSETENQAAALKAENAELLKKLGEAEAAKNHVAGLA